MIGEMDDSENSELGRQQWRRRRRRIGPDRDRAFA